MSVGSLWLNEGADNMETCATCKYWGTHFSGACDKVNNIPESKEKFFEIEATAHDDSGLEAMLITGPDFGCNLYRPKKVKA